MNDSTGDKPRRGHGVCLFSGGLDSMLALRLIADQGLRVTALHVVLPVHPRGADDLAALEGRALGLGAEELRLHDPGGEFVELVRHPRHGYGRNLNPCLDCRLLAFRAGRHLMDELGADFVFSGEVVGERPMSQRREAMDLLERESGLGGRLLRPLSARLLPETEAERAGLVDRERLLSFRGRGRKPQLALAARLGIHDYPTPAGGCLLTDPGYASRAAEALEHDELEYADFELLRWGRHLRLPGGFKLVLGRNREDNAGLRGAARAGDRLLTTDFPAPLGLIRRTDTDPDGETLSLAARILSGYSKCAGDCVVMVSVLDDEGGERPATTLTVEPLDRFSAEVRELLV
jgi:tRNA-uridine 2-sulfurtransferase